jgi:uncharacterized protein (DUF58 family)
VAGASVEFADFRTYAPGDDPRRVDWNVYARLGKLFLRVYLAEENATVTMFLDSSGSMAGGDPVKGEFARRLATALGYAALCNYDRVAVGVCREGFDRYLPPVSGRQAAGRIWRFMQEQPLEGSTDLRRGLAGYAPHTRGPGISIVISDLLTPSDWRSGLLALRALRQEVTLVQVLAPEELQPTLRGDLMLVDSETGERREVSVTSSVLKAYQARLAAYTAEVAAYCGAHGINFVQTSSGTRLEDLVLRLLRRAGVVR